MVHMMMVEYNSDANSENVLTHFQKLNLTENMKTKKIKDDHEGLEIIVRTTKKRTPQYPPGFRLKRHKIR